MHVLVLMAGWLAASGSDYRRGAALIEKGRPAEAVVPLARAVRETPADAQVWKALGVAYAATGDYQQAEPAFGRACELDPQLVDACYYLGRARYALNRFDGALEALARALPVERHAWRARLAMAQAQEALGRAAEAERNFQASLAEAGPDDPRPGVAYGLFLFRQGRAAEAMVPLEAVLRQFPGSPAAHLELGRVLYQLNRLPPAIAHLEQAAALDPASVQAHLLLSRAYFRAGRDADGEREAKRAEALATH